MRRVGSSNQADTEFRGADSIGAVGSGARWHASRRPTKEAIGPSRAIAKRPCSAELRANSARLRVRLIAFCSPRVTLQRKGGLGGPMLEGLDETTIEAPDNELAPRTLNCAIVC